MFYYKITKFYIQCIIYSKLFQFRINSEIFSKQKIKHVKIYANINYGLVTRGGTEGVPSAREVQGSITDQAVTGEVHSSILEGV